MKIEGATPLTIIVHTYFYKDLSYEQFPYKKGIAECRLQTTWKQVPLPMEVRS